MEKQKVGIYLEEDTIKLLDYAKENGYAKTKSDFIAEAIKMYSTWLDGKDYKKFIAPAYESIVDGIVSNATNKMSRNLFKLSVEVSMLMHAIAYAYNMEDADLEAMRIECVKEVKELSGTIKFEDLVEIVKGD